MALVLGYIEEGEPVNLPLPNRRASAYVQSHFYLDDLPQSTEPLDENPRPHSELGARIEDDFVSADEGYQGRPFPQMRRPSFLGPGPETDSESGPDEAFRRDGFDAPRPPPAAPSSSVSGRLGEAALRGGEAIIAAGTAGVGQAVERFGFRNAERAAAQVEQRVLPRIIGRPADAEQLIIRAGQRAQEVERAAAADIEQFAAEQAAAETGETGGFAAVATGAAEALGGAAAAALAPEVAIPAAVGLIRGGHADGPTSRQRSCSCSGRRARGSQGRCFGLPHRAQHRASWRSGCWRLGRGSVGTGHGRDGRSLPGRQVHARRQRRRCGLELRRRVNAEQYAARHAAGALQRAAAASAAAHGLAPE